MTKLLLKPYVGKLGEYFSVEVLKVDYEESPLRYFTGNTNYGQHKLFKDWLFSQNIMIQRENRKDYLVFFNEEDAVMFMLRWGAH